MRTILRSSAFRVVAVLIVLLLNTACTELFVQPTPVPTPVPSPTPVPQVLIVCLPEEPESLYLYGPSGVAAEHIWQTLYDGPVDGRAYAHQPVILDGLPSLDDGTAIVETVAVRAGQRVVDAGGQVVELAAGVTVENAAGELVTFDGSPVSMEQMAVTFTVRSGVFWSDGRVVGASDSRFSFELATDPATPGDKYLVERTADYQVADVRVAVWRGVPGFVDPFYYLNFWHPLPHHIWGHLPAAELLAAEGTNRWPLGWGPFTIREWVPGDHLTVARNPIYFRAPEGLPHLDEVVFRFVPDPTVLAQELLAGRCDVVPHQAAEAVLAALPNSPPVSVLSTYDARWELLAFGISPALGYDRPDFFEDERVRQGIARCIDRQAMAQQVMGAEGRPLHSFIPPEHPLYAGDELSVWDYDPAAGMALLEAAGWRDEDGDGVREAHGITGIPDIPDGTPFQVTYHTTGDPLRVQVAQHVRDGLATCGIQVGVQTLSPEDLFAPAPEGVLFGRRFDLAQFSWRATPDPLCDLFISSALPDGGRRLGPNVAGYLDDQYDAACIGAIESLPGSEGYITGYGEAQRLFSRRLPVLPLFQRQRVTLVREPVVGLSPDPLISELWNIEHCDLRP